VLLAIDTSAGTSVAVVDRDAGVLAEESSADTRSHAELVGTLIAAVLERSGIAPARLSGVAVGMGPGPFTGLRVGIAAGRAFAAGIGRPTVPLVSHDAVAFGESGPLVVVTDARRREYAWSAYGEPDELGLPVRLAGPALVPRDGIDEVLAARPGARRLDAPVVSAGSLGLLAEALYAHGRPLAADEPVYLRPPDVTLSDGPKRVTA